MQKRTTKIIANVKIAQGLFIQLIHVPFRNTFVEILM